MFYSLSLCLKALSVYVNFCEVLNPILSLNSKEFSTFYSQASFLESKSSNVRLKTSTFTIPYQNVSIKHHTLITKPINAIIKPLNNNSKHKIHLKNLIDNQFWPPKTKERRTKFLHKGLHIVFRFRFEKKFVFNFKGRKLVLQLDSL